MQLTLSVSDVPFAENGTAGCDLMVAVSDSSGIAVTGLQQANFDVHWFQDAFEIPLTSWSVTEYLAQNNLPDIPGLYDVEVFTQSGTWTPLSAIVNALFILVQRRGRGGRITAAGRIVYKITDPPIDPGQ